MIKCNQCKYQAEDETCGAFECNGLECPELPCEVNEENCIKDEVRRSLISIFED